MNAVIFANGVIENRERAREAAKSADLVLAANGGALHCLQLGVSPSLIVGDLDSLDGISRHTLESQGSEIVAHPRDKDETDLELALLEAVARNAKMITVLGAMGGRLDMTFANVVLLALPQLKNVHVELWHGDQTAWLARPPGTTLHGEPGDLISLIPLGGDAQGVTTIDLQFAMQDETLMYGPARGISNVIAGADPHIELGVGKLLIVQTPDPG